MHRVELKVFYKHIPKIVQHLFLMHRVELKDSTGSFLFISSVIVPNAPCGVERFICLLTDDGFIPFLMHRVELKGSFSCWSLALLISS